MYRQSRGWQPGGRGMDMNQGPGSSNRGQAPPPVIGTGGPSSNDHLRDLDLELALLKRKRELIEQQQQHMIMNNQSFGRSNQYSYAEPFEQSGLNEPRSGPEPARDFSSFYGEHATTSPGHTARFNRKRPAQQWPTTAPKRFNAPRGRNRHSMPQPGSSASRPVHHDVAPPRSTNAPQQSNRPPASRNRHIAAKVKRPYKNPSAPPNNLQSYPVNERKDLVNKALNSNEFILRQDQPSSAKLTGRLEMALGVYLKELRTQHESGPFAAVFRSPFKLRLLKKSIRERIRSAMLDKEVGQIKDIMAAVRTAYSISSDADILQTALDTEPANPKLAISPIDAVDPEIYIQTNFDLLLGRKLNEMFGMLRKLYKNEMDLGESSAPMMDNMLAELAMNSTQKNIKDDVPLNHNEFTGATDAIEGPPGDAIEGPPTDATEGPPGDVIEGPPRDAIEGPPGDAIEGPPGDAIEGPPGDAIEGPPGDAIEGPSGDAIEGPPGDAIEGPPGDAIEGPPGDAIEGPPGDAVTVAPAENIGNDNITNDASVHSATNTKFQQDIKLFDKKYPQGGVIDKPAVFYNYLVDMLIKRRLPKILPRYKQQLIQILRSDSGYTETKAYLLQQANKKAEKLHGKAQPKLDENLDMIPKQQDTQPQTKDKKPQRFYQYFVKILGRPSLPKRNKMEVFLEQFNPACIKKHRGIHNLLFVGVNTPEDYNKLLDANKTVVGNATLEIRKSANSGTGNDKSASIIVTPKTQDNADSTKTSVNIDVATDEPLEVLQEKADVNSGDCATDTSLDDQITDLLTSLRNDEEQTNGNGQTVCPNPDTFDKQNGNATGAPAIWEPPSDNSDDVQIVEGPNQEIIEIEDSQGEKPDLQGEQIE